MAHAARHPPRNKFRGGLNTTDMRRSRAACRLTGRKSGLWIGSAAVEERGPTASLRGCGPLFWHVGAAKDRARPPFCDAASLDSSAGLAPKRYLRYLRCAARAWFVMVPSSPTPPTSTACSRPTISLTFISFHPALASWRFVTPACVDNSHCARQGQDKT